MGNQKVAIPVFLEFATFFSLKVISRDNMRHFKTPPQTNKFVITSKIGKDSAVR